MGSCSKSNFVILEKKEKKRKKLKEEYSLYVDGQ